MENRRFSFCPKCGGALESKTIGDRQRLVCRKCSYVMYENPIVGVAVILQAAERKILLGRRAKHSTYSGLWCIPCGYVEYDEDVRKAARREVLEETGIEVELGPVYTALSNFHNPETHTVGIWFQAEIVGGLLQAGDDRDAVEWHSIESPPPMAFPSDYIVLEMLKKAEKSLQG